MACQIFIYSFTPEQSWKCSWGPPRNRAFLKSLGCEVVKYNESALACILLNPALPRIATPSGQWWEMSVLSSTHSLSWWPLGCIPVAPPDWEQHCLYCCFWVRLCYFSPCLSFNFISFSFFLARTSLSLFSLPIFGQLNFRKTFHKSSMHNG